LSAAVAHVIMRGNSACHSSTMLSPLRTLLAAGLLTCAVLCGGARAGELSEHDYFAELPEILTVTRLAQPLSDTPGAVTVIDRDTIRRSGARELADVLRLVPGYLVSGFNGANPMAVYHAPIDETGSRNLVLIDGRPVYSAYQQGDTHRGMMGVLLDDIERIEVLRGSNSAAYGANALFGVINVITRHSADTPGVTVSYSGGSGGIQDNMARIGWGDANASFRLSAGRRKDSGYGNARDDKILSQLHFRGDLRPAPDQDLMLAAGVTQQASGGGFPLGSAQNFDGGNALRTSLWRDAYLHTQWRKQLSATDEIKVTASYDEETYHDAFIYAASPDVTISSSGMGRRVNLELQHQTGISPGLRAVWGGGYKYEDAVSAPLYATNEPISIHEERLFGNLEWRPHERWLINAGGFWGRHSRKGGYFSPRLMANIKVTEDHSLRAGITEAERMPTLFEMKADVRFYPGGILFPHTVARNNVTTEKLESREIGYFGNIREWHMTLDVRGYIERMRDKIDRDTYVIPPNPKVNDFVNRAGFKTRGLEYQFRWKPLTGTEIWLNQNFQHFIWDDPNQKGKNVPPTHATTLALFQRLPAGLDLSVMFHSLGAMNWRGTNEQLPNLHRTDIRLAYPFRIGSTRAEAAVVVQAANGSYPEFLPSENFKFERRAFGTLRLEF
jgi:iron complex outermembrane receptor protein